MKCKRIIASVICYVIIMTSSHAQQGKWPAQKANEWYARHGWIRGSNFQPSTAVNQLEMFQAGTFDTATINRELGWADELGFNTMRGF